MIKKKNRAGTSQDDKIVAALQPDYVSVEERRAVDLLMYLREYAQKVVFYDETEGANNQFWTLVNNDGSRTGFLGFDDNEILELAELIENPVIFNDDPERLSKYSKPHLALLLTFIKLLQYPKELFNELTEKNVEFFYKNILKLEEKDEVPDQVHVIFDLARDVREYLLTKGTLLNAGKDDTGVDLHYEVTEDVVLNNARVSDVKTIHFNKEVTNLKYIHQNNNQGDIGFEKMLCLVLGNLSNLPPYITASGRAVPVDAAYLRTELYQRIKGKERDELGASDADYIFQSLCFRSLKEFMACLNLLYREINHGYVGVTSPAESEWEEAYNILEGVHRERVARSRRNQLKELHEEYGFEAMMEYAFGEPEPGNMLYKMPAGIVNLKELAESPLEAARQYIENKLCMTVADFRTVFAKKDGALSSAAGDEVYALLEAAWTKKRGFRYPEIGAEIITGFYADTIFNEDQDKAVGRFSAFGKSLNAVSSEPVNLGFAVSSPLLNLCEGSREIEMVISCKEGSIDYDKISALLKKNQALFDTSLSVNGGWQEANQVEFETGKFIIKPELKTYNREDSLLICDITEFSFFDENYRGTYIGFADGKVYQIESVDEFNREIRLRAVNLQHPEGSIKLIKGLKPKAFVAELKYPLAISRFSLSAQSPDETFDQYYQGKYLVDCEGKIFKVTKFISAKKIEVRYCGVIQSKIQEVFDDNQRLLLNKVWETVELEYEESNSPDDISGLRITGINSVKRDFTFAVNDASLKISYPEGATAQELIAAWEAWKDDPQNDPGRYDIKGDSSILAEIPEISKELELTGEVIKRYESQADNGIRVTYRGRPGDPANLIIEEPSATNDQADFLVSGGILTITPGRISRTANQIAADWRLWLEDSGNDPKGFQVESKDSRIWQAVPAEEQDLIPQDRQIKKCEICNLYGVGIRVWYTGPLADRPKLILQENTVDLFEFERSEDQVLTIKYPFQNEVSAHDLMEAWEEWKASELNDPGSFSLEIMGDGLWTIQARTEKDLQASENQVLECNCTLEDETPTGILARYKLSGEYQNAIIEFIKNNDTEDFTFSYSDVSDDQHGGIKTKVLTITYPPLTGSDDPALPADIKCEYQIRHIQALLSKWNREHNKNGFSLLRTADNTQWPLTFPDYLCINFWDSLNYVCTIDPDGFVVKYRPKQLADNSQFSEIPRAKVVILENDPNTPSDGFTFQLSNDYQNNLKILFIKYPTSKEHRTVEGLLAAWNGALLEPGGDKFSEFGLVGSGTEKWEIVGITSVELSSEVASGTWITDPIRQRFFEYKTNDVNGFTVYYTGPEGSDPQVTIVEHEPDVFGFELGFSKNELYDVFVCEKLTIYFPKRVDKRQIVDLLTEWYNYKKSFIGVDWIQGFEIVDTSPAVKKRAKSELLTCGDRVREYRIGGENGFCISYIGHRDDPMAVIEPIVDFDETVTEKKILWENGKVFEVTGRKNSCQVTVGPETKNISSFDTIKLFDADGICFDALKFTIRLDSDFPAVLPLTGTDFSADPAIRVMLKRATAIDQQDSVADLYDCFRTTYIQRVDLKVSVKGIQDLKMRGNIAMINPANPFMPFGQTPDESARFYFANPEICEKKLDWLQLNLNWVENQFINEAGLPDMEQYYYAYSHSGLNTPGTIKNEDFEIKLRFLDQRAWLQISAEPQALFSKNWRFNDFARQTYQGKLFSGVDQALPKDPLEWSRYYELDLFNQGFMKDFYPELVNISGQASRNLEAAQNDYDAVKQEIKSRREQIKAAKLAKVESSENKANYYIPIIPEARELPALPENARDISNLVLNPPYTPVIQSLTVDYGASAKFMLNPDANSIDTTGTPVRFFRFNPFGYEEMGKAEDEDDFLLPQYDDEGYLMIGIKNLEPLQNVSLLFQMVSGSGDANLSTPEIQWSYLANNKWLPFKQSEILKDRTFGLQDTGIIRFSIPASATTGNTLMPGNRYWIRAEAPENITAAPDILDIRARAVCLTYLNQDNDPKHLLKPLAADSITDMAIRESAVKEVLQPYSSFNGKSAEAGEEFYTRVSERLKHKNRALTLDDYEKLILAQFPQIYKVKCIPQEELATFEASSKGEVVVVVILKNSNSKPFFPLKPKTPSNLLTEIAKYIRGLMPPQVKVRVRNPRFEEVRYRLAVKFTDGYDRGFYINKIIDDIKRYLSPWAYDQEAAINFGSTLYSSSLINYLENQDYVDYIANFNPIQQLINHETYTEVIPLFLTDDNEVSAKYPDSILVSAESHIIDVITTEFFDPGAFRGIGHMKIETDFWIDRPGAIFSVGLGQMELEAWPVMRYAFIDIPVKVNVTAFIRGEEYPKENYNTRFSRADSEQIWKALCAAGYLDEHGNVVTDQDLYDIGFHLFGADGKFAEYLVNHLLEFSFQINPIDFDPTFGKEDEFSYRVESLDTQGLEMAVINMIKAGLSFNGLSQYPFIVY